MERGDAIGKGDDDIIIVKVTGNTSKTITIPDTVCEFLDIDFGDILKLKIKDKRKGKKRK
jgi:DNA-binding Xre family transcriptional regulator